MKRKQMLSTFCFLEYLYTTEECNSFRGCTLPPSLSHQHFDAMFTSG